MWKDQEHLQEQEEHALMDLNLKVHKDDDDDDDSGDDDDVICTTFTSSSIRM
jgi:hypothetical protein